MRYLVTGSRGFLGRYVVQLLLQRGQQVFGISRQPVKPYAGSSTEFCCDLTSNIGALDVILRQAVPAVVVHLAATSFEPFVATQPWRAMENNLLATLNLLTACRRSSPDATVVAVSSSVVYGRQPDTEIALAEDCKPNPLTIYGVSKLAVEALVTQHHQAYGLPVMLVRPFNLTGPGEHASFVTSAFARQIALVEAGKQAPVIRAGNLGTARDFTDVRDAASAVAAVAELGRPGEVYNLCSGVGVAIADLLSTLLQATPIAIDVQSDPTLMRPVEIQSQRGDSTKLKRATGWQPRYALEQTLADVLDDWRARIQERDA